MKVETEKMHSPTPWGLVLGMYPTPAIIRSKESCDGPVRIAEVFHSASYAANANARLIIRAVNSHEALVTAITNISRINRHEELTFDQKERQIDLEVTHALASAERWVS